MIDCVEASRIKIRAAKQTCPDCGSGMRASRFNRNGWFYADCGRRWHPEHGWETMRLIYLGRTSEPPRGCLRRQLDQAKKRIAELEAREQVGWLDPGTKRFCYCDIKDGFPDTHERYTLPVFRGEEIADEEQ